MNKYIKYQLITIIVFGSLGVLSSGNAWANENEIQDDFFSHFILKKISPHIEELNAVINPSSTFDRSIDYIIKKKILSKVSSMIHFRQVKTNSYNHLANDKNVEYEFYFGSTPICEFYFNSHQFQNQNIYFFGKIPRNINTNSDYSAWPDESVFLQNLVQFLADEKGIFLDQDSLYFTSKKRCLQLDSGDLAPAMEVVFSVGNRSFRSIIGEQKTFFVHSYNFEASGIAKVYEKNPMDGKIAEIPIEVDDSGNLTNDYFTTITNGVERAREDNFVFEYEPSDPRFSEALTFAHVNQHLQWFEHYGYKWQGAAPLELILHGSEEGSTVQVYYQPSAATTSGIPQIRICDGDGTRLQNLTLDADVVSHEFGHHIIFSKVTNAKEGSEALLLHEGLSDYFVFSRTGDNCLGESICPKDSKFCWLPEKCLRTADNSMLYKDADYIEYGNSKKYHLQSQMLSGFLWDLSAKYEIPTDHLNNLVIYTVLNLLGRESGFRDLLVGLMQADLALSAGKYACIIQEKTETRKLTEFVAGASCYPAVPEKSSKKKNELEKLFSCGVIKKASETKNILMLLIITLIPILFIITSRFPIIRRQK